MAADYGNTAGHEFPEIIPCRSQNPEFRRFKPWIAFGHGHAPCPNAAAHIYFALGSPVHGPVGGVSMDNNFSSGIEPANIIGSWSHYFDSGVGVSQ